MGVHMPDVNNPQVGDRFESIGGWHATVLFVDGNDVFMRDFAGYALTRTVDVLSKRWTPVESWPDTPTDHYAVQRATGSIGVAQPLGDAEASVSWGGGRILSITYTPWEATS